MAPACVILSLGLWSSNSPPMGRGRGRGVPLGLALDFFMKSNKKLFCYARFVFWCVLVCSGVFWCVLVWSWCDSCVFCGAFDASGPPPGFRPGGFLFLPLFAGVLTMFINVNQC